MRATCVLGWLMAATAVGQWRMADPPAATGSGMPFLSGSERGLWISWTEPAGEQAHALRAARWEGSAWGKPETISTGKKWFVNWADLPALEVLPDGSMLAHWLTRFDGAGKYGYGIRIGHRRRLDTAWKETAGMNLDDPEDYAGFLSFRGRNAAYLAPPAVREKSGGHEHGEAEHRKTLRFARFAPDGKVEQDTVIDEDVCSCCPTSMVETPKGLVVAYRDHLPGEIRDISLLRFEAGRWSEPKRVHADGWKINGCPTEGPAMASAGPAVAVAWMTRAGGEGRLQVAWSGDAGETFRAPVRGDDGNPLGRPAVAALNEREAALVWLEKTGQGAEVRVRRILASGRVAPSMKVAEVSGGRASGIPKIAAQGDRVYVAWREDRVRAAWLEAAALPGPGGK